MHRFLLLCFFFPIYSFAYNIIFVHLGNTPPPCIFTTMKQARCFNENSDIYLLTDKNGYDFFTEFSEAFLHEEQITLINSDLIPTTPEHKTFHSVNKIEPSIYDGFWFYTSERFFVLFDFIQDRNLTDIVHLENDSMLYVDLDELNLTNLQLAAPFQSLKGCIPCFVFIKDREILSLLIRHILSEMATFQGTKAHIRLNDMQTLASFYVKFGDTYMTPLPTLIPEYSKYYSKRKSRFAPDNSTRLSFLSMNASLFPEYIFDAAGLGIFLNGNDRKRSPHSGPGTIHSRSLFDPSVFSFFWKPDTMKRVVPYLSFKGKELGVSLSESVWLYPAKTTKSPLHSIKLHKKINVPIKILLIFLPFRSCFRIRS
jgi:hypothetical protein